MERLMWCFVKNGYAFSDYRHASTQDDMDLWDHLSIGFPYKI